MGAGAAHAKIVIMRAVPLPDGSSVPCLGLGTWRMGESRSRRDEEVAAVREALEIGYRLIDTAEMYADGGAEQVVGQALRQAIGAGTVRRDDVTIVTKVVPGNASRKGVVTACERSLERLGLDRVDIFLLHWRGPHPLAETIAGFEALRSRDLIRAWGVSNFDVDDLEELSALDHGGSCVLNQVYYSASKRGIEFDLLPAQRARRMATMAYCPIDQGALASAPAFAEVARRHAVSAAQAALAWVLRQPDVIAIPKAARASHLRDNFAAVQLTLAAQDHAAIDARYPPPKRKQALAMT
jgi:diketogulonate reductase-like aldo/keto reductase